MFPQVNLKTAVSEHRLEPSREISASWIRDALWLAYYPERALETLAWHAYRPRGTLVDSGLLTTYVPRAMCMEFNETHRIGPRQRDQWGTVIRVDRSTERVRVTSAGADRTFGTPDDWSCSSDDLLPHAEAGRIHFGG